MKTDNDDNFKKYENYNNYLKSSDTKRKYASINLQKKNKSIPNYFT